MGVIRPIIGDQAMALAFPQFPRHRVFIEAGAVDGPAVEAPWPPLIFPKTMGIVSSGCETVRLAYSITIAMPFLRSSSMLVAWQCELNVFGGARVQIPPAAKGARQNVEPF
jgi:hypothetical protein